MCEAHPDENRQRLFTQSLYGGGVEHHPDGWQGGGEASQRRMEGRLRVRAGWLGAVGERKPEAAY